MSFSYIISYNDDRLYLQYVLFITLVVINHLLFDEGKHLIFAGFGVYFKDRCDRYEKYIALLINGGRFVLSAFIENQLKERNRDLGSVLNEHTSEEFVESLGYEMSDFNQTCLNEEDEKSIPLCWDISKLAMVIDVKFGDSIERVTRRAVKNIATAYQRYASAAVVALDWSKFETLSSDLKANIKIVANYLEEEQETRCQEIITKCTDIKVEESFEMYMDALETQSTKMKSFRDIFNGNIFLPILPILCYPKCTIYFYS